MVADFVKNAPPEVRDVVENQSPVPGLLEPSDVGQAAAMLCAPNSKLTGVAMPIDGGLVACAPSWNVTDYVAIAEAAEAQERA